jgi:type I restriction enzyme S subunit
VSEEKFSEIDTYSVIQGDVIISRAGTVGKMGVVRSKHYRSLISTNLIRVRFGELLLPEYFVSLMIYCRGRIGRLKTGPDGSFTHMNTGVLDTLEFPYPPIQLQNEFLSVVNKVGKIKSRLLESLSFIEKNAISVSDKAFSGDL